MIGCVNIGVGAQHAMLVTHDDGEGEYEFEPTKSWSNQL